MAVGQITEPQQAETIIANGQADMVALGRHLMFDPHWAWKAAAELGVFLKYPARYRNANPRMPGDGFCGNSGQTEANSRTHTR